VLYIWHHFPKSRLKKTKQKYHLKIENLKICALKIRVLIILVRRKIHKLT
jgi:hypothetical protein